jgi:hypothetical protein
MAWFSQAWQVLKTLNPLKLARAHVESELEKIELKQTVIDLKRDKQALEQKLQQQELSLTSKPAASHIQTKTTFGFYNKSPRRVLREFEAEQERKARFQ